MRDIDYSLEIAEFTSRVVMAEIEMNAMMAENKQCEALGHSMAYTGESFMELIDRYSLKTVPLYRG